MPRCRSSLQALITPYHGKVALYAVDLRSGNQVAINADTPVTTASVIKLTILYDAIKTIQEGHASFADRLTLTKANQVEGSGRADALRHAARRDAQRRTHDDGRPQRQHGDESRNRSLGDQTHRQSYRIARLEKHLALQKSVHAPAAQLAARSKNVRPGKDDRSGNGASHRALCKPARGFRKNCAPPRSPC